MTRALKSLTAALALLLVLSSIGVFTYALFLAGGGVAVIVVAVLGIAWLFMHGVMR